jgi:hypothetical protein
MGYECTREGRGASPLKIRRLGANIGRGIGVCQLPISLLNPRGSNRDPKKECESMEFMERRKSFKIWGIPLFPSRGPTATTPLLQRGNGGSIPSGTTR